MEGEILEDAEPIFELAVECEKLYIEQIARLKVDSSANDAAFLSELNQRFAAWAAFLGVFAESKICLDRRLRHHIEIQEQVLRLLDIMQRNLTFVVETDDSPKLKDVEHPDELQRFSINIANLEAISEAIERLNHIGIAIRQSSVTSHTAKAREFAETFDLTSFEGFAYMALKTMYISASEELLELLTRSMTETYALFLHRKSRHEKLQASRERPQTPVPLYTISEESAADADASSSMDLDLQISHQSGNSTTMMLRPPPPPRRATKTMHHSEPTSIDSQEAKARIRKMSNPSINSATTSILVKQAEYSRPARGSITCEWCFSPLPIKVSEGDEWQKHVNKDHKPYLCISEKCPETSPRFATSRKWLEHMLTTHGQNWHREAYAPSSWICPLCHDDDTTFFIPSELANHLAASHGNIFTQLQIEAIVQQSRIRSLRPRNECPLCCLSIEVEPDLSSKEKSKDKEERSTSKKSRSNANVDHSLKRIKREAGYTELDQHVHSDGHQAPMQQRQQEPRTQPNPPKTKHLTAELIASHIAGHLQAITALTLRMISIDVAIGVSADNQSVSGDTDDPSSRAQSIQGSLDQGSLDQEIDTMEDIPMPEDCDVNPGDGPYSEEIPDSKEHFNWNNMGPDNEVSVEDDFLDGVVNSGAFQSHLVKGQANPRLQQNVIQKTHYIVPFEKNDRFTGREFELIQLEEMLFSENQAAKVAVFGLGGVGKTSLVIELVHRVRKKHENCSILWIPATNLESLHQAYLDVACQLGIRGWEEDSVDVKGLVEEFLSRESAGQWLLVFDNADDIDMWVGTPTEQGTKRLIDYLPRSKLGCIVFTTRDRKTAFKLAQKNVVEVSAMSEDVATIMLQEYLIDPDLVYNKSDMSRLLNKLIYLPLAIVQASAYINENRISLSGYLSLLAGQEEDAIGLLSKEFEDNGRYQNVKNPVATTWLISFEQIRQRDPLAAEYLSFMACIDSRDIPQSLLPRGQSRKEEMDAIGTLDAYSFVTRRPGNDALDLHRLVHLSTRNWLNLRNEWGDQVNAALSRVGDIFPWPEHENRALWMSYQIHAQCVLTLTQDRKMKSKEWYSLACRVGKCFLITGKYQESLNWARQVLQITEEMLGKMHPETLTTMSNLARVLDSQGQYTEAETVIRQTLKLNEEVLGKRHLNTLTTMGNLALVLNSQGKYSEAETMNRQTLKLKDEVLGKAHPDTLTAMSNLARVLDSQGKYTEAETMNRQTLKLLEELLGKAHPDTLTTMNNLARVLDSQGKYTEAETINRQTLKLLEEVLGKAHPDTLTTMNNLARVLDSQGKYTEAETINRQTLKLMEEVLGKTHPSTLITISNLARILDSQGKYTEAETMNRQMLKLLEEVLGKTHPSTLITMSNLARVLSNQGKHSEAETMNRQTLKLMEEVLGETHPDTLTSVYCLAYLLQNKRQYEEASVLYERACTGYKSSLGPEHPTTKACVDNYSAMLKLMKKFKHRRVIAN